MSAFKRNRFLLVFCLAAQAYISVPVYAEESVIYQNVKASSKWDRTYFINGTYDNDASPAFLSKKNNLYLKIQSTRTKWHLYVEVDQPDWNPKSLHQLVQKHPEILPMFPEPNTDNFGVKWSSDTH